MINKNYIFRIIFLFCVSTIVIQGTFARSFSRIEVEDTAAYERNPNYDLQMGLFDIYKTTHANIVMLGNSITQGVNWSELLGRNDVIGRGIGGDILSGYINRLNYVIKLNPKVCFIMGGINDIYNWFPVEDIFANYVEIVNRLTARNIKVIIQSTLYVSNKWHSAEDRNREVERLNNMLKDFAKKYHLVYMDLNESMSENKMLKNDLTIDGVHPNAKGYAVWREKIEETLRKLNM